MAAERKFSPANFASCVGAIVLIGSQSIASAFVFGWALAGLFGMPQTIAWVLEAVLVAVALAGTWWFARQAMRADPPFVTVRKG